MTEEAPFRQFIVDRLMMVRSVVGPLAYITRQLEKAGFDMDREYLTLDGRDPCRIYFIQPVNPGDTIWYIDPGTDLKMIWAPGQKPVRASVLSWRATL